MKIRHSNIGGENPVHPAHHSRPSGEKQPGGTSADCGAGWERGHQGKVGRGWQERQKTQEWPRQSEKGGGAVGGGLWISFSVWHLPMCVMHTSVFTEIGLWKECSCDMKRQDDCQHLRKIVKDGQTEEIPNMGWWKDETFKTVEWQTTMASGTRNSNRDYHTR